MSFWKDVEFSFLVNTESCMNDSTLCAEVVLIEGRKLKYFRGSNKENSFGSLCLYWKKYVKIIRFLSCIRGAFWRFVSLDDLIYNMDIKHTAKVPPNIIVLYLLYHVDVAAYA